MQGRECFVRTVEKLIVQCFYLSSEHVTDKHLCEERARERDPESTGRGRLGNEAHMEHQEVAKGIRAAEGESSNGVELSERNGEKGCVDEHGGCFCLHINV